MLHITNIRLLSKVQGIFDNIDTPEYVLKIAIDDAFFFPEAVAKTDKHQSTWSQSAFPLVQLAENENGYTLTFIAYRNGVLIGTAKTTIKYGQILREQNDIISSSNTVAAKILYQCQWYNSAPPGTAHINNEQFLAFKYNNVQGGAKPTIPKQTATQKQKVYVRQAGDQDCGGFCGCFGSRKKKKEKAPVPQVYAPPPPELLETQAFSKEMKTGNYAKVQVQGKQVDRKPCLYTEAQLVGSRREGENSRAVQQPKRLSYYSKSYFLSR